MFDFLKKPILTEKATQLIEKKQYTFDVDARLTKKQIKKIFEDFYSVRIQSIQTSRISSKKKRRRSAPKPLKRVILCLSKNQEITLYSQNSKAN